jgi:hypothetical protein
VIDVQRPQSSDVNEASDGMQQNCRVETAADGDGDCRVGAEPDRRTAQVRRQPSGRIPMSHLRLL